MKDIEYLFGLSADEQISEVDRTSSAIYYVTSLGRLFSLKVTSIAPNYNKARGYLYLRNRNGGKQIHRLVADNFIGKVEGKNIVKHKDGNKRNNNVNNLEWCTSEENARHALNIGLTKQMKKNEGPVKFSNEQVLRVVNLIKNNGYTYIKAGATEGMSYSTVAHIMSGRRRGVEGIKEYEKK